MDIIYRSLAEDAAAILASSSKNRIVIAISGVPGSGKSTLALGVSNILNDSNIRAQVVGMDGYHLTRAQLSAMPDPITAHKRRGAPFTFNAQGVVDLVARLQSGYGKVITAPSFDHSVKDPVEDGIVIDSDVQVVLLEGLYLLLKDEPWRHISDLVDAKWMVQVSSALARDRVAKRHLAAGIVATLEDGYARADGSDFDNGQYLLANSVSPDRVVVSTNS